MVNLSLFLLFLSSFLFVACDKLRTVPDDFFLGASTSAYQVEGAWNEDGKGESMWDRFVHTNTSHVVDGTNGDIASDSYHSYKKDVQMLVELGANAYRFSISWSRILPRGTPDLINPKGVAYYNNLINELLKNGITPFVTIYHWDLPQGFSEKGGWLNEDTVESYGNYARVLFRLFGDRVKYWLTINEPHVHCYYGYGYGLHAPVVRSPGVGYYECGRNILLANARAYHIYDEEFRSKQNGQVGFVIIMEWAMIQDQQFESALEDFRAFNIHYYMDPIFSAQGDYPARMVDRVAHLSAAQGFNSSRLRPFTQHEIDYLRGTADFLGLNHYTSKYIYRNASVRGMYEVPSNEDDVGIGWYMDESWSIGLNFWGPDYPQGFLSLLHYIHEHYPDVPIYITENGVASVKGLDDQFRAQYLRKYVDVAVQAREEGVDVRGYFVWSLMDTFEWSTGYTLRFGIYELDNEDAGRRRTARKSALVYQHIIKTRSIDFQHNPDLPSRGTGVRGLYLYIFVITVTFLMFKKYITVYLCVLLPAWVENFVHSLQESCTHCFKFNDKEQCSNLTCQIENARLLDFYSVRYHYKVEVLVYDMNFPIRRYNVLGSSHNFL